MAHLQQPSHVPLTFNYRRYLAASIRILTVVEYQVYLARY